jgi:hypothetical protein
VKVLFIGEGRHDIGDSNPNPSHPRSAQGTIPTLTRRVCPSIRSDSIALAWTEIQRFNPAGKKRGYPAKITAAALLAVRKYACAGTVVVADRDGQKTRQSELEEGVTSAEQQFPGHSIVWGLAIESVEAWTLGVPDAIAEELGVEVGQIREHYPRGVPVELMSERSGKSDHRPKQLLERLAQLKHRQDSAEFRQAIAERTNVDSLARACPQGFAPFADQLRKAFGQTT